MKISIDENRNSCASVIPASSFENPRGGGVKMKSDLCKDCKEIHKSRYLPLYSWDHCHHGDNQASEKPKNRECWCEYSNHERQEWLHCPIEKPFENSYRFNFCPVCGKELQREVEKAKPKDKFLGVDVGITHRESKDMNSSWRNF